ncbi:unnamed protein product [Angiostrongylus costaricensis]|uniref:Jumonji domain-containing protein 4 n=1 Tax=Angiostrongylus costaricensis TaxID=334426 RepID=A0A0R3PG59_ANGCS|nr:unnamed protein product [Angiostrongylus costaricensis]
MTLEVATINGGRIRHLQVGEMSWLAQFANFCIKNEPCVLHESFTTDWPSRELWVREDGTPDLDYLRKLYGEGLVPVITESKCDPDEITFNKFCDYCESLDAAVDSEPPYLKDWHFQKSYGINMYHIPAMLTSDWANCENWTDGDDNPFHGDYRFVYFGLKNTWTRFHSDVMSSHSWSANICGRKLWYLVPAGNENVFIKDGDLVKDIRPYKDLWPEANLAVLVQKPGEIVFVPANWYHQVHNLEDTISINHNSINASNVHLVYAFLCRRLMDVKEEIGHLSNLFTKEEMIEQEQVGTDRALISKALQIVLGADARLNMPRLRCLLQMVVVDRSKGLMATCYVCCHHSDPLDCMKNSSCLKQFATYCQCTKKGSVCCERFMHSFELSVAISLLDKMTKDGY